MLEVPEFKCPFVAVPKVPKLVADDSLLDFAWFLRNILLLGVRTLSQAITRVSYYTCAILCVWPAFKVQYKWKFSRDLYFKNFTGRGSIREIKFLKWKVRAHS